MQQRSGQHFAKNIEMVSKKRVVLKKGQPVRTKYVFLPRVTWIPWLVKSTNMQRKRPAMNFPGVLCCLVQHLVLVCTINAKTVKINIKK